MPSLKRVNFNDILTFERNTDKTGFVLQSDGFGNQVPTLKIFAPNEPAKVIVDPLTKERLGISIHGQRTNLVGAAYPDAAPAPHPWTGSTSARFTSSGADFTVTGLDPSKSYASRAWVYIPSAFDLQGWQIRGRLSGITVENQTINADLSKRDQWQLLEFVHTGVDSILFTVQGAFVTNGERWTQFLSVEEGTFHTPPIITNGSPVTRLADNLRITDINQSDWWNPNEGTLIIEWDFVFTLDAPTRTLIADTVDSNFGRIICDPSSGNILIFEQAAGGTSVSTGQQVVTGRNKLAISFNQFGYASSLSGASPFTRTTSGSIFGQNSGIRLGQRGGFDAFLNGTIKSVIYEPRAMTAEELQSASQLGA